MKSGFCCREILKGVLIVLCTENVDEMNVCLTFGQIVIFNCSSKYLVMFINSLRQNVFDFVSEYEFAVSITGCIEFVVNKKIYVENIFIVTMGTKRKHIVKAFYIIENLLYVFKLIVFIGHGV